MATEQEFINYKDFVESLDSVDPSAGDKTVLNVGGTGPKSSVFSAIATFVHNTFAAFVNALTAKISFVSGDKIPVVNGSTATAMDAAYICSLLDKLRVSYEIGLKQNPDQNVNSIKVPAFYNGTKLTALSVGGSYHCFIFPVIPGHNYAIRDDTAQNAIFASQIIFDSAEGLVGGSVVSDLYKTAPATANYLIVTTLSSVNSLTLVDTTSALSRVCNSLYGDILYSSKFHTTGSMNTAQKFVKFEAGKYKKLYVRVSVPDAIAAAYSLIAYFRNASDSVVSQQSVSLNYDNFLDVPADAEYLQLFNFAYPSTEFDYTIFIARESITSSVKMLDFLNSNSFYGFEGTKSVASGVRFDWTISLRDSVSDEVSGLYVSLASLDASITNCDVFFRDSSSNILEILSININESIWLKIPRGTKTIQLYKGVYLSASASFTLSVIGVKLSSYLQFSLNTSFVSERGSFASQDLINKRSTLGKISRLSNQSKPIIALIYDDGQFDNLVSMADQRGIKVTVAPAMSVNPSNSGPAAFKYRSWSLSGHGTCAHGQVSGLTPAVPSGGIDKMNDYDANRELNAINGIFDHFLISRRGLVQFDTWQNNPHVRSIAGGFYDYVVGFGSGKNEPGKTDPYFITRGNTDSSSGVSSCVDLVNWAIGKNVLIVIGGHMTRTGTGGSYSSMAEFTNLLDLIEGYVNSGDLLTLNMDDAVDQFFTRCKSNGVVPYLSAKDNPCYGQQVLTDEGLKVCADAGSKYVYSVAISGTASAGEIVVEFPGDGEMQEITITTTANEDIEDVVDDFIAQIYKAVTLRKKSASSFNVTTDLVGDSRNISVTSNTSGLSLSLTMDSEGSEAVFI